MTTFHDELSKMRSDQAAQYVVTISDDLDDEQYDDLLESLCAYSWTDSDRELLLSYYLRRAPYRSTRIFEALLSFVSPDEFMSVYKREVNDQTDLDLFRYNVLVACFHLEKPPEFVDRMKELLNRLS